MRRGPLLAVGLLVGVLQAGLLAEGLGGGDPRCRRERGVVSTGDGEDILLPGARAMVEGDSVVVGKGHPFARCRAAAIVAPWNKDRFVHCPEVVVNVARGFVFNPAKVAEVKVTHEALGFLLDHDGLVCGN